MESCSVTENQSNPILQVAMTPKGTSVRILGCLSLLMSTCRATVRPTVLELILDSVKNIEDLVRDSYMHQPVYLISPAGRNGIINSPYPLRPREIAVNFDPSEEEVVREHLHRHPKRPKTGNSIVSQSSMNENVNSNGNENEYRGQIEEDATFDQASLRRFRLDTKPRNDERALGDNESGNTNSNSNGNNNGNGRSSLDSDVPAKNTWANNGAHYGAGVRSLSRARDSNRNVNDNDNTNSMSDDNVIYDEI